MKQLGYYFFKYWISFGLFFYFQKLLVFGSRRIPKDKPVLFLSNHQNALLDVLLIATSSKLKPWYLTRSDVFKSKWFSPLFYFLQMLPIYRIRDGKDTLSKNQAIFDRCGELLNKNEALLIFPEANHSLKRRVRPLSKGFTRLLFNALEENPDLDIKLIPVGQNYNRPTIFPDSAALYYGEPISVQDFLNETNNEIVSKVKTTVSEQLKKLTTHIEDEVNYDHICTTLEKEAVNFLYPKEINKSIVEKSNFKAGNYAIIKTKFSSFLKYAFTLVNLPIYFTWRTFVKPKVPEPEFMDTFRFAYSMIVYPIFYFLLLAVITHAYTIKMASLVILAHAILNFTLIKVGFTSFGQRK